MQKNIDSVYYNHSGYYDPTAGSALDRIMKCVELIDEIAKTKKKRRNRRKKHKKTLHN